MRLATRSTPALLLMLGIAGTTLLPAPSHAQFDWGRRERQWIIETPGPARGYSGFVGPRNYYCDYVRYPNRRCTIDARGRERCRITSWRMVQRCS